MNIKLTNGTYSLTFTNIGKMEGFEYGTNKLVIEDLPGRVGAQYIYGLNSRRRLSWRSIANNHTERSNIIKACQVGSLKKLEFEGCNGIPLQTYVEIDKLVMPYKKTRVPLLIEAVAPDYRFYSQTENTTTTGITTPNNGTVIPTVVPMSMSYAGTSLPVVTNAGNITAPVTFVINGPGTDFLIKNVTTGKQFNLTTTLLAGEYITIDTSIKTVIKGTNTNVFGLFSGDFWELVSGNNKIYFNVISGNTIATTLEIKHRDTYGGI